MKLLIADDDLTSRTMLAAVARKWGFEPVVAEDGEVAWQILQGEDPPRLLLLDWMMPQLNGLELCQRIRQQDNDEPPFIILLTSRRETADIVAGLASGANDYVAKPFENAELQARLQVGRRMVNMQTQLSVAAQALIYQASYDDLTKLMNRRGVMDALAKEFARAQRESQTLCVGLCDIDHFKQVNDTYGHLVGDVVLSEVAKRMEVTLRPYDHIGRYGGEEFLIVLTANRDQASIIFERLHRAVTDTPIIVGQAKLGVSVSCGVSIFAPLGGAGDSTSLLAEADNALYEAKESGRNRTVFVPV